MNLARLRTGPWATDPSTGLDEHDLGEARHGRKFSIERNAADAIDAIDASAPDNAEDEFRAADESECLSDHPKTSPSRALDDERVFPGPWRARLAFGKVS